MTLMSALHLNLGGAPAGPAGTGGPEQLTEQLTTAGKGCVMLLKPHSLAAQGGLATACNFKTHSQEGSSSVTCKVVAADLL